MDNKGPSAVRLVQSWLKRNLSIESDGSGKIQWTIAYPLSIQLLLFTAQLSEIYVRYRLSPTSEQMLTNRAFLFTIRCD